MEVCQHLQVAFMCYRLHMDKLSGSLLERDFPITVLGIVLTLHHLLLYMSLKTGRGNCFTARPQTPQVLQWFSLGFVSHVPVSAMTSNLSHSPRFL